ncbi:carbohydrate porin [Lichenicoccus sp.]|uniref:carbohydrate porin n=1 Tax=Lichenicoccus sp. TaxID=2781899 RepID=UPI003D0F54A6
MPCKVWLTLAPAILIAGLPTTTEYAFAQSAGNTSGLSPVAPATLASPGNIGSASGISTNPSNNTTGDLSLQQPPLPISGPPLSGLFPAFGQTLLGDGIDIHGLAVDHFLANPSAGNITGQTYNLGFIAPAVDLDLGRIAGISGGNVHVQVTVFGLRSNIPNIITDVGGFLTGYQTTPAPSTTPVALTSLTYEQKLLDDKLSVEVGRTNLYHYFLLGNGLDIFTNASSTLSVDGDFNSYPFPVWGGARHLSFYTELVCAGRLIRGQLLPSCLQPGQLR